MDEINKVLSKELALIEHEFKGIIKKENNIDIEIDKFINGSSKKIRSILTILYLKANNKEITPDIIHLLTGCELIHNASLLHDDIIDNSTQRRGDDTLEVKFNAHISILSGDYLVSLAVKYLTKLNNFEILRLFTDCTQEMCNAEINQYLNRGKIPNKNDYIEICRGKTGSLFATTLHCAAILTGLEIEQAKNFGNSYGILFQILNDMNPVSAKIDNMNKIYTAFDIFGIEKTESLKDNYKKELSEIIKKFPNKHYSQILLNLVNNYDR